MLRLLTPAEVARRAGVTPEAVVAWDRRGVLKAIRTETGRRLFKERDVTRFLERRSARAAQEPAAAL